MEVLDDFKNQKIYFAWQLDTRGKASIQYAYLVKKGTEFIRAVLDFGEPQKVKINKEVAARLITYGATLFGNKIDKILEAHQIDWVKLNERKNLDFVMKAKKPFLFFFRWCLEFKIFREAYEKNESYPIYIDASTNALQQFIRRK